MAMIWIGTCGLRARSRAMAAGALQGKERERNGSIAVLACKWELQLQAIERGMPGCILACFLPWSCPKDTFFNAGRLYPSRSSLLTTSLHYAPSDWLSFLLFFWALPCCSMPARSGRGSSKGRRSSTTTTAATTTSGASGSTSVRKVDEQDTPEGLADVGLIPGAPGKPDQPNWLSGEKDSYIWNVLLNDKDGEVRAQGMGVGCWVPSWSTRSTCPMSHCVGSPCKRCQTPYVIGGKFVCACLISVIEVHTATRPRFMTSTCIYDFTMPSP
eukprot:1159971-Pelagomonas_calceolata.AAC.5